MGRAKETVETRGDSAEGDRDAGAASRPRGLGLKTKLIASFLLLSLLPIFGFTLLTYSNYERVMNRNAENYLGNVTDGIEREIASYFKDIVRILRLQSTYYVLQYVKLVDLGHRELATRYAYRILQNLNYIRQTKSNLNDIRIITSTGTAISTIGEYRINTATNEVFQHLKDAPANSIYYEPTHRSQFGSDVISIAEPIIGDDGKFAGVIEADVSDTLFARATRDIKLGANGYMVVVTPENKIVYDSKHKLFGRPLASILKPKPSLAGMNGNFSARSLAASVVGAFRLEPSSGWKFLSISPKGEIIADIGRLRTLTVLIFAAGAAAFVVFLSLFLSALLTNPIRLLQERMRRVSENDLSTRVDIRSGDEIGQLARSFNEMTRRIKKLMSQIVDDHEKIRRLEIRALHEQIKPHFMYNTLESIMSLLEMDEKERAMDLLEDFGTFLRTTLRTDNETASVGEELEHVSAYLSIQRFRLGSDYEFSLDVPEELRSERILHLILQPVVENAIVHGFSRRTGQGQITVKSYQAAESFLIEVADNGVGIPAERLSEIQRALDTDIDATEDRRFLGLRNVNVRIRLAFGPGYGIRINSTEGCGTSVTLRLPHLE